MFLFQKAYQRKISRGLLPPLNVVQLSMAFSCMLMSLWMILITIGSLYLQILTCRNIFCVLIMIVSWVCTGVVMQHITVYLVTFIGAICRSMCEIGCAAVHIASDSNPFSLPMGLLQQQPRPF